MKTLIKLLLRKIFGKGQNTSSFLANNLPETTTFEVSNSDPSPKPFRVLGDNWSGIQVPGVSADVAESSLGQVTRDTLTNAWMIDKIKVITNNPNNFNHPLYVIYRSATGYMSKDPINLVNWQNPENAVNNIVVSPDNLNIKVTGDIGFEGILEPNSNMSIIAYRKKVKQQPVKAVNKSSNFAEDLLKSDGEIVIISGGQQLANM